MILLLYFMENMLKTAASTDGFLGISAGRLWGILKKQPDHHR
jgi:hypothetical protein